MGREARKSILYERWADEVRGGAARLGKRTLRALGMDGFGGLGLAGFGRADFAHGGVAGALAGPPHVPACDGAVGAPAFAEGEEFLGLGHEIGRASCRERV